MIKCICHVFVIFKYFLRLLYKVDAIFQPHASSRPSGERPGGDWPAGMCRPTCPRHWPVPAHHRKFRQVAETTPTNGEPAKTDLAARSDWTDGKPVLLNRRGAICPTIGQSKLCYLLLYFILYLECIVRWTCWMNNLKNAHMLMLPLLKPLC
jgi:hypothetical protein